MTGLEYTFAQIDAEARKLVALMDDPHPGIGHWGLAVFESLERLAELRIVQQAPSDLAVYGNTLPPDSPDALRLSAGEVAALDFPRSTTAKRR